MTDNKSRRFILSEYIFWGFFSSFRRNVNSLKSLHSWICRAVYYPPSHCFESFWRFTYSGICEEKRSSYNYATFQRPKLYKRHELITCKRIQVAYTSLKPLYWCVILNQCSLQTALQPQTKNQRRMDISPVYTSRKIKDEIKVREVKTPLVNYWLWPVNCAMQVMSALLLADTYTKKLKSINDRQLDTNSRSNTISSPMTLREILKH